MPFKLLKKLVSILTIVMFLATNCLYAAPGSRSLFKNKKVDYDKISNQSQDILQKKQSVLKGEDIK
nr:hypothetical protein [Candidatus Omnitrophota bacterium]